MRDARVVIRSLLGLERIPDGVAGIRDVDHPCDIFEPGEAVGDCQSDGHYLCLECMHMESAARADMLEALDEP